MARVDMRMQKKFKIQGDVIKTNTFQIHCLVLVFNATFNNISTIYYGCQISR